MICAWSAELRALQLLELRLEDDFAWYSFLRREPWAAYKHMQHAVRTVPKPRPPTAEGCDTTRLNARASRKKACGSEPAAAAATACLASARVERACSAVLA